MRALEAAVLLNLERLLADNPIAFYELVCLCRDRQHVLWGNTAEVLSECGLLESSGQPHGEVRLIVNVHVEGDGLDMVLR